jgi:hypothetical protein
MIAAEQVPAAVYEAFKVMPKELERALGPTIQRTLAVIVQQAVRRDLCGKLYR